MTTYHCRDCGSPYRTREHVGGMRGGLPPRHTVLPTVCSNRDCIRSDPDRQTWDSPVPDQS